MASITYPEIKNLIQDFTDTKQIKYKKNVVRNLLLKIFAGGNGYAEPSFLYQLQNVCGRNGGVVYCL